MVSSFTATLHGICRTNLIVRDHTQHIQKNSEVIAHTKNTLLTFGLAMRKILEKIGAATVPNDFNSQIYMPNGNAYTHTKERGTIQGQRTLADCKWT